MSGIRATAGLNANDCLKALLKFTNRPDNIIMPNVYFGGGEADFISIGYDGYVSEYEIKVSLKDWNDDRLKNKWNDIEERNKVRYFWYVVPEGLIGKQPSWVPLQAGLMAVKKDSNGCWLRVVRYASSNDYARKISGKDLTTILKKGYTRYIKNLIQEVNPWEVKQRVQR